MARTVHGHTTIALPEELIWLHIWGMIWSGRQTDLMDILGMESEGFLGFKTKRGGWGVRSGCTGLVTLGAPLIKYWKNKLSQYS